MAWTKGRKQALIDSIVKIYEENGIDISGNELALNGLNKMNEKELDAWEDLINELRRLISPL